MDARALASFSLSRVASCPIRSFASNCIPTTSCASGVARLCRRDNVGESTRKAQKLGAKIVQDVMKVGGFGMMSVIQDPTGAYVAMWQPIGKI